MSSGFVDETGKVIMQSNHAEDDATEHRIERRITTDWEVEWILKYYAAAREKEAKAQEEYRTALQGFRRAATNYAHALGYTNQRIEEAIESSIALPDYARDGVTPRDESLGMGGLLYAFKTRADAKVKVEAASQLASGTDW